MPVFGSKTPFFGIFSIFLGFSKLSLTHHISTQFSEKITRPRDGLETYRDRRNAARRDRDRNLSFADSRTNSIINLADDDGLSLASDNSQNQ